MDLAAGDEVVRAVDNGFGLHIGDVGAGVFFRSGDREEVFAAKHLAYDILSPAGDEGRHGIVDRTDQGAARIDAAEFLDADAERNPVLAVAAHGLRGGNADQAGGAHLGNDVVGGEAARHRPNP